MKTLLETEALLREASEKTGLRDYGDRSFLEGLERLWSALQEEAGLSAWALREVRARCLHHLRNRLRVQRYATIHPEVREREIRRPVVLATFPRSGSTLFHKLLCQAPGVRVPAFWECWQPTPPRSGADHRKAQACENYLSPMGALFPEGSPARGDMPGADEAAECYVLLQNSFASLNDTFFYAIPSYLQWLEGADMRQAYAEFRLQLAILNCRDESQPWILKSADHLLNIGALMHTFPDARVIHISRPMEYVLPSLCRLMEPYINAMAEAPIDPSTLGHYCLARLKAMAAAAATLPERVPEAQLRILSFEAIVAEPVGTARELLEWLDIPLSSEGVAQLEGWLSANPRPPSAYELDRYGLKPADLDSLNELLPSSAGKERR